MSSNVICVSAAMLSINNIESKEDLAKSQFAGMPLSPNAIAYLANKEQQKAAA